MLIERDTQLARLNELLDDARGGDGHVVLVRGEAGIGKSSLVREFLSTVDDAHTLIGGCDDLLAARPLGPIWDMAIEDGDLEHALDAEDRQATFRRILELLDRRLQPTVMVIEDVHWADAATIDLVRFVGRRIGRTHGLVVITYRDGDVLEDHPLRVALGDLPYGSVTRVQLEPLSPEGVATLAGPGRDVGELWELTGGNPFFVTEAIDADTDAVPSSIRDAIVARLGRLSSEGRELAELVSVVPGRCELTLVDHVFGDAHAAMAECESAGLLELAGDALAYRHELARRAVEESLSSVRRRQLNLAGLTACAELGMDIARCAHHAREAGDSTAIVHFLPEAARRASDLESHSEAVANLRALEPYLDHLTPEELGDHYDRWAYEEYLWAEMRPELIERAIAIRRELGDPAGLGHSLLRASRIAWVSNRRTEALDHVTEAIEVLQDVGGEELAMAYSSRSQLAMLASEEEDAIRWAEAALAIAPSRTSHAAIHAMNNIGSVLMLHHFPDGVSELEESARLAASQGLAHDEARAEVNLAWGYLTLRMLDRAEAHIDRAQRIMHASEMPTFESYGHAERAWLLEMRGAWDEAEAVAHEVVDRTDTLGTSRIALTNTLARIDLRRGSPDGESLVDLAWSRAVVAGEVQRTGPAAALLAERAWLTGRSAPEDADRVRTVAAEAFDLGATWIGGEVALWAHLAGWMPSVPEQTPDAFRTWLDGDWRGNAAWWADHGLPYEQAVALSFGDAGARIQAIRILDDLGAVPLATRIRGELARDGVTGVPRGPRRETRANPLGLTPRQADVLDLVATGLTNPEIADRLFISSRTVDHHVSAILAKLGASTREEAARVARESGIVG